jgi:cell wall-associated NlpC family hydrolase
MAFDDAAGRYAAEHANLVAYDSAAAYTAPAATTEAATEASYQPAVEATTADVITTATSGYQAVVDYALQFVGNPYVYGGTSLTNGADCSGFTLSVYANYGISLPHSASAQANYGTEVGMSDLEAGDLLFYADPDGSIGHVAIYTGDGMVVHASTEATGIKTSVYNYRTPVKAVRLLGQ